VIGYFQEGLFHNIQADLLRLFFLFSSHLIAHENSHFSSTSRARVFPFPAFSLWQSSGKKIIETKSKLNTKTVPFGINRYQGDYTLEGAIEIFRMAEQQAALVNGE